MRVLNASFFMNWLPIVSPLKKFASWDLPTFRDIIRGKWSLSVNHTPEAAHFPGFGKWDGQISCIKTDKTAAFSAIFHFVHRSLSEWVTYPGEWTLSGTWYSESDYFLVSYPRKCFVLQKGKTFFSLKGQSHEIFCTQFFHQSVHSGPIRDVLGPFIFFCFLIVLLDF